MVASGLGVTFLPGMAVSAGLVSGVNIAMRPIDAENPVREIVVAWRAGSNRRAEGRLLAAVLQDVCEPG
jgi:LysR family hydrogen peroxide-inducible transcriptional activator